MKNLVDADGLILVAVIDGEVSIADVCYDGSSLPSTRCQDDGLGVHEAAIELVTRIRAILSGVAHHERMLAAEAQEGD